MNDTSVNLPNLRKVRDSIVRENRDEFIHVFLGSLSCKVAPEDWNASLELARRVAMERIGDAE